MTIAFSFAHYLCVFMCILWFDRIGQWKGKKDQIVLSYSSWFFYQSSAGGTRHLCF